MAACSRVLRLQDIPSEWSEVTLAQKLRDVFGGIPEIRSHCSSAFVRSRKKTALVTFNPSTTDSVQMLLQELREAAGTPISRNVGDEQIYFDEHLHGLTTLYEPPNEDSIIAE